MLRGARQRASVRGDWSSTTTAAAGFGRITLWLMLAIVATLTIGLAALAVSLHVGVPPSTRP